MVFQKLKNLLLGSESKVYKKPSYSMSIISASTCSKGELIYGIVSITKDIDAAVVELLPQGTINKGFEKKSVTLKERTVAIVEISTKVKYDYKEIGAFSKWHQRKLHFLKYYYPKLKNEVNQFRNVSSEVPCQVIVMFPPAGTKIDVENKQIYDFLKNKFQNKLVSPDEEKNKYWKKLGVQEPHEWSNIDLQFSGLELSFNVVYAYPNITTKIDENTHISYIIPEDLPSDYKLKMFKFLPKEFRKEFLEKIPLTHAETLRISEDKSHDKFIEHIKVIEQIRKEFQNNLANHRTTLPRDDELNKQDNNRKGD